MRTSAIIRAVALFVVSANHHDFDISQVEEVAQRASNLSDTLKNNVDVRGYAVLSTCNRFEICLDSTPEAADAIADQLVDVTVHSGIEAARHVYDVASGLDSMVVGEREIVSQVRTSLKTSRREGTTSKLIEQVLQGALSTSRKVAVNTDFSHAGRSIVGAALDMANSSGCRRNDGEPPDAEVQDAAGTTHEATAGEPPHMSMSYWANIRVLLVGTGAYAGATVAALKARGANNVRVWSQSGRGEQFAADHDIEFSPTLDLMTPAVVILCRGTGSPVVTAEALGAVMPHRPPLTLIDLARSRDVEVGVKSIPGVRLIDLETIRHHLPAIERGDIENAQRIIDEGLQNLGKQQIGRGMDPLIVGVRNHLAQVLERELEAFPATGTIPAERAIGSLQRFAATLAYQQSENARRAAEAGRAEEFHAAAELVFGTSFPIPLTSPLEEIS